MMCGSLGIQTNNEVGFNYLHANLSSSHYQIHGFGCLVKSNFPYSKSGNKLTFMIRPRNRNITIIVIINWRRYMLIWFGKVEQNPSNASCNAAKSNFIGEIMNDKRFRSRVIRRNEGNIIFNKHVEEPAFDQGRKTSYFMCCFQCLLGNAVALSG